MCTLNIADGHKRTIASGDVISRQVTWNPSGADVVAIMDTPAAKVPWHENEAYNRGMAQWVATRVDLASHKRVPLAIGDPVQYLSRDFLYIGQSENSDAFVTPGGMTVERHDSGTFVPRPSTPFAQPAPGIRLTWNLAEASDESAPSFGVKQDVGREGQSEYAIRIGTPDGSHYETLARVYSPPTGAGGPSGFAVCFSGERLKLDWAKQLP